MNENSTTKQQNSLERRKSEINRIVESMITGATVVGACAEYSESFSHLRSGVVQFRKFIEIHSDILERLEIKLEQEAHLYGENRPNENGSL